MMKAMLTAVLALVLAGLPAEARKGSRFDGSAKAGPDYEKLLSEAKFSLSEAIDRGLKEAKEGALIKAEIEREGGKTIFTMDIAQGTKVLEVNLDVAECKVVNTKTEEEDRSAIVKSVKITLKQAIEAAVKKTGGKAVAAAFTTKGDSAQAVVKVWNAGKLVQATVDTQKGDVLGVADVPSRPAPGSMPAEKKKPGFLGIQGEEVEGGVKITTLVKDMPAVKAGLKEGDVVCSINGKKVKSIQDIATMFREIGAGEKVKVTYRRGDKESELTVTLAARGGDDEEEDEDDDEDEDD